MVIAVPTYCRPELLGRLLPQLVTQADSLDPPAGILVVDNDPAGSAWTVCDAHRGRVDYVHEIGPGISRARNRALLAASDYDLLVFMDDDETPTPGWLTVMVDRWRQWRCAAVAGPVVAQFPVPPDEWLIASRAFDTWQLTNGALILGAATNNLLLDLVQVRAAGLRFDERFGLTGGEDTMFTRTLTAGGGVIRWCVDAVVEDPIATGRMNRRWVLLRTFRAGSTWTRVVVRLSDGRIAQWRTRFGIIARASVRLASGSTSWIAGSVHDDVGRRARGAVAVASGAGMLTGIVGYVYAEYRRPTIAAVPILPTLPPHE